MIFNTGKAAFNQRAGTVDQPAVASNGLFARRGDWKVPRRMGGLRARPSVWIGAWADSRCRPKAEVAGTGARSARGEMRRKKVEPQLRFYDG